MSERRGALKEACRQPKLSISVMFDVVRLDIVCSSDYAAQVLFDDFSERLAAGQVIGIEAPNGIDKVR